jgi:FkbM family methyltransferase
MSVLSKGELARFLAEKRAEIGARALMSYPASSELETREVAAFQRLFDVLDGPFIIRHPHVDFRFELGRLLGPRVSYLIAIGDYELTDLELLQTHLVTGDRVMELGGGAGLTAAVSAKVSGSPVVVVEPDDRLFPLIRRQVELNGGSVSFEHGAILSGPEVPRSVEFYLDDEIWFSSMHASVDAHGERPRKRVEVPALGLAPLLEKHRPTVVMMDIEGAERGLFAQRLAHLPRKILIEIHAPHYGERVAAEVVQSIVDLGYRFVDQKGWTYVFDRSARAT